MRAVAVFMRGSYLRAGPRGTLWPPIPRRYIQRVLQGRARLSTALAVLTVAGINAAGLWGIAAARRDVAGAARRLFRADTEARARALDGALAGLRADLEFLGGLPPVTVLVAADEGDPGRVRLRASAEAALLVALRTHPEVTRLTVRDGQGRPLLMVGRRGGVPILWVAPNPTGAEGPAVSPHLPRPTTAVAIGGPGATTAGSPTLEAEISSALLLAREAGRATDRACRLEDGAGRALAVTASAPGADRLQADARVAAEGWTAPAPWRLHCEQPQEAALALVEPVAARYRATLAWNVGAMTLAVLLGAFTVREIGQRERLEARARTEARVRDLERQLFHSERLTTVGRLAAGIAHEINNPLEGIANYLTLAREALDRGDLEGARRRLEGVGRGLERAALVVRQVLSHADPAEAPKGPVDLNRVLAETTEFVRSRPEFARVRFQVALAEPSLMVVGSPIMLGQVALNLVVNACEAQPGGGEVRVSSRRDDGRAVAEIADRGPGIAEADRARIFEPFFSTKNSTGLGLSICHSIVAQHGGALEALPREDGGTVFRMSLPAAGAAA
jgi:signal transduction histidine kinase